MNNTVAKEYIQKEKKTYGRVFSDITFALDDINDFKEGTDIESRYFFKNIKLLDKYMTMVQNAETEISKKKKVLFVEKDLLSSEQIQSLINGLELYKDSYKKNLNKLVKCSSCKCLKCMIECPFKSCMACSEIGKVTDCDKKTYNFILFTNYMTRLYNSETRSYDTVKVLAQVSFSDDPYDYRVLNSNGEYLILKYKNNMGKEEYNAVEDKYKFNFVANLYEKNVGE